MTDEQTTKANGHRGIQVKKETHAKLKALSETTGISMARLMDQAVELRREELITQGVISDGQ